ncbi:MAG: hypothetical protein JWN17_1572 [Frankiales bacterium]|nr:hypothetical protein [Frankiales bacterium]
MTPEEQADQALLLAQAALDAAQQALELSQVAERNAARGATLALASRDAAEQAVVFAEQVRSLLYEP